MSASTSSLSALAAVYMQCIHLIMHAASIGAVGIGALPSAVRARVVGEAREMIAACGETGIHASLTGDYMGPAGTAQICLSWQIAGLFRCRIRNHVCATWRSLKTGPLPNGWWRTMLGPGQT